MGVIEMPLNHIGVGSYGDAFHIGGSPFNHVVY